MSCRVYVITFQDNKQGNRSVDGPKKNDERDHEHNPQPSSKHDSVCLYIKKQAVFKSTAIDIDESVQLVVNCPEMFPERLYN